MSSFDLHPQLAADSNFLRDLPLSQLRQMPTTQVPWFLLVPRLPNVSEILDLSATEQTQLMQEIAEVAAHIRQHYQPDKINIAALGNQVPQLHVHIIGRFRTDAAWPKPIWGIIAPH